MTLVAKCKNCPIESVGATISRPFIEGTEFFNIRISGITINSTPLKEEDALIVLHNVNNFPFA